MNFRPGDHIVANAQPAIIITIKRDSLKVCFEDGTTDLFFKEEIEIDRLLEEFPHIFYFQRGTDVLRADHGSVGHYCTINSWPRSPAFKRKGKGGPALSMAPERRYGGLTGVLRLG